MRSALIDLTGQRFSRLTVLERVGSTPGGNATWHCLCDCGALLVVAAAKLRNGDSRSCGCLKADRMREMSTTHGQCKNRVASPTYMSWYGMHRRCTYRRSTGFKNYGGRGISVCERWQNFANFMFDMGARPAGASLDRINNNGNYEPGNCRWATPKQQAQNRRMRMSA